MHTCTDSVIAALSFRLVKLRPSRACDWVYFQGAIGSVAATLECSPYQNFATLLRAISRLSPQSATSTDGPNQALTWESDVETGYPDAADDDALHLLGQLDGEGDFAFDYRWLSTSTEAIFSAPDMFGVSD